MKKTIISLFAAGLLASVASAQLVYNITGDTGVKATFTFTFDDTAETVTVAVDNTIAGVGGATGTITGFGFQTPFTDAELGTNGDNVTITSQTTTSWLASEPWEVSPAQFTKEYGVSTDGSPNGSNPTNGITFGSSATFVFTFPDFVGMTGWGGDDSLAVRFQTVVDSQGATGQSDKVLGTPDDGGGGGSGSVPEPSTYGMFGALALLGMMVVRQMRRR